MKSLSRAKKARKIRGLAIKHLLLSEQEEVVSRVIEKRSSAQEVEDAETFLNNVETTQHGIGRAGALELLMKASTFVAITEMERVSDEGEGDPR